MAPICSADVVGFTGGPKCDHGSFTIQVSVRSNPRGPLIILKESWTQDNQIQANLIKPVEDNLLDLKTNLEEVTELAQDHAFTAQ